MITAAVSKEEFSAHINGFATIGNLVIVSFCSVCIAYTTHSNAYISMTILNRVLTRCIPSARACWDDRESKFEAAYVEDANLYPINRLGFFIRAMTTKYPCASVDTQRQL
jgi:hypothetical protein